MVEGVLLGPLLLFAVALTLTPGPNVVMVTATCANFGFRRTLPHMLGITVGFGGMVVASGLGLAGILASDPRVHSVLRYAGAIYLVYLAWRIATADPARSSAANSQPIGLIEAALFTWTNPKAWVTALGALAAYIVAPGSVLLQTVLVACVLTVTCFLSVAIWVGFGVAIGRFLERPSARQAFNCSMAALLIVSLIPVFR